MKMSWMWKDADGNQIDINHIKQEILSYVDLGGTVYVGTDSMLHSHKCNFTAVIAFHNREHDIARYYYKNIKKPSIDYRDLQKKILEEVSLAIETAQFVIATCPEADIEVHVDVGTKKKNATSKFLNTIQGWVTGTGFDLRVKPESWASSLADTHTKRMRG
jgi:predicted RNase H-related nuclease YkuK (DUF458 family)